ncbi:MAG: AAA family ATPase [Thermoplasmata archaeon]
MPSPVALTGTPGTGKSAVARALRGRFRSIEVSELARALDAAKPVKGGVEVDLSALRRRMRRSPLLRETDFVVGHLAQLLPLRDVVVLRCHPVELERRLKRARRGTPAERHENFVAEATDVVLLEALGPGRRVWEIDTSRRSVAGVAEEVARRVQRRGRSSYGTVDWLSDRRLTAHLLDRPR